MGSESSGLLQGFYLAVISREKCTNSWESKEELHCAAGVCGAEFWGVGVDLNTNMNLFCFSLVSVHTHVFT